MILSVMQTVRTTNKPWRAHTRQAGVYLIELPCFKLVIYRLQTNFYVELYIPLPFSLKKKSSFKI